MLNLTREYRKSAHCRNNRLTAGESLSISCFGTFIINTYYNISITWRDSRIVSADSLHAIVISLILSGEILQCLCFPVAILLQLRLKDSGSCRRYHSEINIPVLLVDKFIDIFYRLGISIGRGGCLGVEPLTPLLSGPGMGWSIVNASSPRAYASGLKRYSGQ